MMNRNVGLLGFALLIGGVGACSSSGGSTGTTGGNGSGSQDPGVTGSGQGEDLSTAANPYGVAYPTKGFGVTARNGGRNPGSVLKNFRFLGYPGGDKSNGLQPINMANFFDPEMRQYKVIVFAATGNWCTYCRKETSEVVKEKDALAAAKIAFIQGVVEGASAGKAATQTDFDKWVADFDVNFNVFVDDGKRNMGPFFPSGGLPFNLVIDARSMELLQSINGYSSSGTLAMAQTFTAWVDSHPASTY